ncbi:MAG: ABC transporter ATP-binding protein [Pirellulaceae bacterium]|nr:ABC transporter ATP-binding protein [Pirellulaceae bacterium]
MLNDLAIEARGLTRYFDSRMVVSDFDLSIPRGSVTGLLGLNGAGKTTTLRILMGLLAPTRGESYLLGKNSQCLTPDDRARIGYTVEGHFLYGWMTVRQSEKFHRETFPRWNAGMFDATVRRFGIEPSQKIRHLSRGQKAGVSLALTMAAEPELLVLDDPALGLDPVSRLALNETLLDFCDGGTKTILLSSHLLDDVERVADRVAVMVHGRLVVNTTVDDFRSRVSSWAIEHSPATRGVESIPGLVHSRQLGGKTVVTLADCDQETEAALTRIGGATCERLPITFDEAVIAYLSRSRESHSFLSSNSKRGQERMALD